MNPAATATGNGRRAILDRLRTRVVHGPELPTIDPEALITYADPVEAFCQTAVMVGAACHRVTDASEIGEILSELQPYRDARRIASLVPEEVAGNTDLGMYDDPHFLKGLDWVIARGLMGVAENGAVWVETRDVPHRVCFFITQYLAIVLRAADIVPHMHAAYRRLGDDLGSQSFGVFISGPSKTADIEQSLVIGAHGCRALNIFIV